MSNKISRTYRLSEQAIKNLEAHALSKGQSVTDALENLLLNIPVVAQKTEAQRTTALTDLLPLLEPLAPTQEVALVPNPTEESNKNSHDEMIARARKILGEHKRLSDLTLEEKREFVLETRRKARQIDIDARVEAAERIAKVNARYQPMKRGAIEFPDKGGAVKLAEGRSNRHTWSPEWS